MNSKYIRIIFILIGFAYSISPVSAEVLKVGYVSGGLYEQYLIRSLTDISIKDVQIEFVPTEGSREQMQLLEAGSINIAIVQSDIAYYTFEGKRGYKRYSDFSILLPLFEEYLHVIVNTDSEINTLGRLLAGTVSVGQRGSGTFQNSSDLFRELGFRSGIDFQPHYLPIMDGLQELKRGTLDGVLYTGGMFPFGANIDASDYRILEIPENIIEAMSINWPYYTNTTYHPISLSNKIPVKTVSVVALLVASNELNPETLAALIEAILAKGLSFQLIDGSNILIRSPESAIEQSPIPLHDGLKIYLRKHGHIGWNYSIPLLFLLISGLIGFIVTVRIRMRVYDRMGNFTASQGTTTHLMYQGIAKSGTSIIALFIFFLLVVVFGEAIQYFEDSYARKLSVRNPFADRGFWNSLLWVLTFMGAGDPGDIFPNSSAGKFLASILPFLGIGAVLGFGYSSLEKHRVRRAREREGVLTKSIRDHVLICGWNEKAPGIIYTLTSSDVPRKREVVVVAEMEGRTPLDKYRFDLRYVTYCRGDSADHKVLLRANASYADVAIVLGGVRKRNTQNIRSVLTVLALRELSLEHKNSRNDIMLIAELIFSKNEKLFSTCGADAIVSSETISDRVAAISCVSPLAVDFILDMLTYDIRSELYALPVESITELAHVDQNETMTLGSAASLLWSFGINVVAANNKEYLDPPFLDHAFTGEKFCLLLDAENTVLCENHELLIIADDFKEVKKLTKRKVLDPEFSKSPPTIEIKSPPVENVLLVGDPVRCERIRNELRKIELSEIRVLATKQPAQPMKNMVFGDYTEKDTWQRAGLREAEHIMILACSHEEANTSSSDEQNTLDAQAILIAKFASVYIDQLQSEETSNKTTIAAEMLSAGNQKLFKRAGVDTIIPTDRIIERVISKLVYSRGAVSRFLMALLRFDDGKHFMTFEIDESMEGVSFIELPSLMPRYFQLLGVLPGESNGREQWVNRVGDFDYHFMTTIAQDGAKEYKAKEGDILLGIVNREAWLESQPI